MKKRLPDIYILVSALLIIFTGVLDAKKGTAISGYVYLVATIGLSAIIIVGYFKKKNKTCNKAVLCVAIVLMNIEPVIQVLFPQIVERNNNLDFGLSMLTTVAFLVVIYLYHKRNETAKS